MSITRPTGGYAEQMLDPGGWPEVDEDAYYGRAREYTQVLRQVTEILETCRHQQGEVFFDGGAWSGAAASAANGELATNISELITLQNGLATVVTWQRYIAGSIVQAKSDISDNVEVAQKQIIALENDSTLDADERITAINTVVIATHGANLSLVAGTAEQILASKAWKPPNNALRDLLDQKTPPSVTVPATPSPVTPSPVEGVTPSPVKGVTPSPVKGVAPSPVKGVAPSPVKGVAPLPGEEVAPLPGEEVAPLPGEEVAPLPVEEVAPSPIEEVDPQPSPTRPAPVAPAPVSPGRPSQSPPGAPGSGVIAQPTPGMPPLSGQPRISPAPTPGGTDSTAPGAPVAGEPADDLLSPADPLSPSAPGQSPAEGGGGKGMTPASGSAAPQSAAPRSDESSSPSVAPAAATGIPVTPMAPVGSGGAAAGPGAGSGPPVRDKPSSKSPTTRPAAASKPAARTRPAARSESTDRPHPADAVAITPIPVSAARAERDAIAEAATADAARRQRGGADPLRLARRIAAALNAPGSGGEGDFGFFWVTAVAADGAIVVANSYGLAYIPDGVQLPELVHMASADEAIPAAERARWATYPVIAVQGWAAHHNTELRAVIATEEQLANSDPGVAKIVLKPDDIPARGDMIGRSRLQVVDPEGADRLAATTDLSLISLLPPPPVDASPPADQRPMLWFEVMKPMTSRATGRQTAHLRAFHAYAAHAQEIVLKEAHTAVDPVAQRSAVADWLYWEHLTGLLDAALADAP
jgi:hypothetical protein